MFAGSNYLDVVAFVVVARFAEQAVMDHLVLIEQIQYRIGILEKYRARDK